MNPSAPVTNAVFVIVYKQVNSDFVFTRTLLISIIQEISQLKSQLCRDMLF